MPAAPRIVVFNANETQTDDAAEQEELGTPQPEGGESAPAQPAEPAPPESGQPPAEPQQAAPKEAPNKTGVVPYDRFNEVVKQNQELRERWARMDERSRQLNEARQAAQQAAEAQARAAERPDPGVDPVGAQLWDMAEHNKRLEQQLNTIQNQFNQTTQGLTKQQQEQEFSNWVTYEAQRHAQAEDPHYFEKATHAANWRKGWWQELGPNAPPEAIHDIVQKESFLIAAFARQYGGNFARSISKLGDTLGWKAQQVNGNGAAQPVAQPGQRVAQLQRGQAMQGLGRAPAGGNEANTNYRNMKPSDLYNISEAEHSRLMADKGQAGRDYRYALALADGVEPDLYERI